MSAIDSWQLAFSDIAILEDRDIYLDAMEAVNSAFGDRPLWWRHWAARDVFRENGGRLIEDLPAVAQENYRRLRGGEVGGRRDDRD
jgi:hypothetical protein